MDSPLSFRRWASRAETCAGRRLSLQTKERTQDVYGLGPQRAEAFLAALAVQAHGGRRLKTDGVWTEIQCFLNPRAGVVEKDSSAWSR